MRRSFLFIFLALVAVIAAAQTVTKNSLPKNLKGVRMNLVVDFSKALIYGMSEEEFSKYEKDWGEDKPTIVQNFKSGANYGIGKSYGIGDYSDASYTIVVTVNTVTNDGFIICDATIVDKESNCYFKVEEITGGKEPVFSPGTKLAKMKFWATLTGKKLGTILKNEFTNN